LKTIFHRPIQGTIKTCTLRRSTSDKWFISFSCEIEIKLLPHNEKAIGIDMGLTTFATYSDGTKIENPRFFRTEEKNLAKVQKKLMLLRNLLLKDLNENTLFLLCMNELQINVLILLINLVTKSLTVMALSVLKI